jgi:hypothetical protein
VAARHAGPEAGGVRATRTERLVAAAIEVVGCHDLASAQPARAQASTTCGTTSRRC